MQSLLDQFDPLSVDSEGHQNKEQLSEKHPESPPPPLANATTEHDHYDDHHSEEPTEDKTEQETQLQEEEEQQPQLGSEEEPNEDGRPFDFQRFLSQLRHKRADPIARYLKSFLSEFNKRTWTTTEQVKIISDFKIFIANKMEQCPPFSTLSENEFANATEGMEKLVMNRLYSKTFSPEIPADKRADDHEEDVLRDRVLEEKMRIWHWIEGRHLDLADRFLRNGEAFVKLASDELIKISHYRAPRDKIICILNCCKVIFGLLRQTDSEESADGFLPILIYVLIKAQPKDLISNVNYIQRFRDPDRLGGETGYYISSLIGAISFVETLDRSALSITDEEFERNVEKSVKSIAEPSLPEPNSTSAAATSMANDGHPAATPSRHESPAIIDSSDEGGGTPNSAANGSNNLNPSSVLYNSAGLFTAPFKTLTKLFEESTESEEDSESQPSDNNEQRRNNGQPSPQELAARQVSAEEHEAQRIHQEEFESVSDTLSQMFPTLDREVIQDVLREKESRVGAAVDACLVLVGTT